MSRPTTKSPTRTSRAAAVLLGFLALAACERDAATPGPPPPDAPTTAAGAPPPPDAAAPALPAPPAEPQVLSAELSEHFRLIEQRSTGPARVRLKKHLKLHPDDGQAEFLFGLTYHREKRYAQARPWFERAIEHAPDYDTTYYFLGWCLYYLGEPDASRAAFVMHLRYRPDEGDSHFGVGLIDLDEDRLDEAEARFRRAIELSRDVSGREKRVSKARARLADVLIRRGFFEQARAELEAATEMFPDHYEAFYKLFRVLMRLGLKEEAEVALEQFTAERQRLYPTTRFPE